jgi:hypothetical protein
LLAGRALDQHKAAWLIDQAVAGVVDLVPDGTADEAMVMVRLRSGDPAVARMLDIAFRGRDRVTLGGYDRDFARMWAALGRELSAWQDRSGLWDSDADRRARRIRVVGALAGVAGAIAAIVGGYYSARLAGLPVVLAGLGGALAGAGAACAVRGWEARVFTPEGSAAWMRVESLRQFLAQSPPTAVDAVIASGHIGRFTAWAVALGEAPDRGARRPGGTRGSLRPRWRGRRPPRTPHRGRTPGAAPRRGRRDHPHRRRHPRPRHPSGRPRARCRALIGPRRGKHDDRRSRPC